MLNKAILALVWLFSNSAVQAAYTNEVVLLGTANSMIIRGEISDESVHASELELLQLVTARGGASYPIYIVLDSPGGSVGAGIEFIEFVKTFRDIKTISMFAASMAAGIVEALPGERLMPENGTIMFHRAKGGVDGQFGEGELESRLGYIKSIIAELERTNATRMNLSVEMYQKLIKDELWYYGRQAYWLQAVDKMVDVRCTKKLLLTTKTVTVTFMGLFTIDVEFSQCPLIKGGTVVSEQPEELIQKYQDYLKKVK